jgi:hypothetical protein
MKAGKRQKKPASIQVIRLYDAFMSIKQLITKRGIPFTSHIPDSITLSMRYRLTKVKIAPEIA